MHSRLAISLIVVATLAPALAQVPAVPGAGAQPPASALQPAGPKKRIAVVRAEASAPGLQAGGPDLGAGVAAQLTTALIESGQFIVIERADLASVLREQELGAQRLASGETAAQVGRLLGAQLLVRAVITEFEQRAGGGGLRLGFGSGSGLGALGAAANTGVVGIDVRLVDTTTGQVVQSYRAEGKVEDRGVSADIGNRNLSFGTDTFERTPLGRAAREAIGKAVGFVVAASRSVPWSGRVVEVSGDQLFVNAGADAGVRTGDAFVVSTVVRELTDPASGALLGVIEERVGEVRIQSVEPGYSVARMTAPFATKRGDLVRPLAR